MHVCRKFVLVFPQNEEENSLCVKLWPERFHPQILSFPLWSQGYVVACVTPFISKLPLYISLPPPWKKKLCLPYHCHIGQHYCHIRYTEGTAEFFVYWRNKRGFCWDGGESFRLVTTCHMEGKETGEMESQWRKVNKQDFDAGLENLEMHAKLIWHFPDLDRVMSHREAGDSTCDTLWHVKDRPQPHSNAILLKGVLLHNTFLYFSLSKHPESSTEQIILDLWESECRSLGLDGQNFAETFGSIYWAINPGNVKTLCFQSNKVWIPMCMEAHFRHQTKSIKLQK